MKPITIFLLLLCLTSGCFWNSSLPRTYTIYRSDMIEGVNMMGKENSVHGFLDDLFNEIAKMKGFKVTLRTMEHTTTEDLLEAAGSDGAIGTIELTLQNKKTYLVSDSIYAFGPMLVIRAQDSYKSLADLKNKVVGFDRNYAGYLEGKNNVPFFFKPYDQMTQAMEDLINGSIDAVVCDSFVAYQYANSFYANKIKVVTPLLKEKDLRLITFRDLKEEELIKLFNEGLKELKSNGTYKKMLNYWGLVDPTAS